jgi:PAS domain S-box-containing protein
MPAVDTDRDVTSPRSVFARYGTAVALALLATALNFALTSLVRGSTAPIFLGAVMAATWFGGFWPGILATTITLVAQHAYIAVREPAASLTDLSTGARLVLFWAVAIAAVGMLSALRSASTQAIAATRDAEAREDALRTSELRFRGLLDAAPDAMIIVDSAGRIVLTNRQAKALFGYEPEELLGQPIEILVPAGYRGGHVPQRDRFMAEPRTRPMGAGLSLAARRKDGTEVPVEISLSPVTTRQGLLVTAAVRDVTDRKRTEAQIAALNADLQQRVLELTAVNRELEAFSYSVSHDLRAPLRSIDGFSQALLEEYQEVIDDQGRDYLRRVRAAATRMGELIDDLLNLSRVTRREMRHERVDLSAAARAAADQIERARLYRPVEFVVADDLVASGDPHLLRIVLDNLLGNAWKFSSKAERPRVEFGVTTVEGERAFFVRDNGVGFAMAHAGKLFGAFQRLHGMHEFPGTGIGLATVQRIVTRHGGRVWAEAAPGQGATFYFTLGVGRA